MILSELDFSTASGSAFSLKGNSCAGFAASAFSGDLAHLAADAGAIHDGLLNDAYNVADRPVESKA